MIKYSYNTNSFGHIKLYYTILSIIIFPILKKGIINLNLSRFAGVPMCPGGHVQHISKITAIWCLDFQVPGNYYESFVTRFIVTIKEYIVRIIELSSVFSRRKSL